MLNKFCCCCTLRQGSFAIAYSYLAFLVAYLTALILKYKSYLLSDFEVPLGIFIDIVLTLLLTYGVHKKKWMWLLPWVMMQVITIATFAIYAVMFSIREPYFLGSLPFILFAFYLCLVVYSYSSELRKEKSLMQPINYAKASLTTNTTVIMNPIWNENYIPPTPPPPYSLKDETQATEK